jgi:hypothetical protein
MSTQTIRIWTFTIAMVFGLLPGPALTVASAQEDTLPQIVSGTLVKLDLRALQGLLRTDLGKLVFFEIPKVYLFENITVGARIIVQLDPEGQAVKVMDASLPDLMGPIVMPVNEQVR